MERDEDRGQDAAQDRYWRANTRLIAWLMLLWVAVTFVPPLFARDIPLTVFGAPFSLWVAAQGAPIVYVLIAWYYERRMDRLDRERRGERDA